MQQDMRTIDFIINTGHVRTPCPVHSARQGCPCLFQSTCERPAAEKGLEYVGIRQLRSCLRIAAGGMQSAFVALRCTRVVFTLH